MSIFFEISVQFDDNLGTYSLREVFRCINLKLYLNVYADSRSLVYGIVDLHESRDNRTNKSKSKPKRNITWR